VIRQAYAEIDISAIKSNIAALKKLLPGKTQFMAVVKANGYGHGSVQVAKAALSAGANRLGVALVEEAIPLRQAGIIAPIQLLTAVPAEGLNKISELDLIVAVYTKEQADSLNKLGKPVKVHIKADTGMNRIGVSHKDAQGFIDYVSGLNNIEIEGMFTHFATADQQPSDYAKEQWTRFKDIVQAAKESNPLLIAHAANSAATILYPQSHLDMVRVGIAMYGLHPSSVTKSKINLCPALSLKAKLSYVKKVGPGECISYGATHTTSKRTVVGTIPLGYADGYTRLLSNKCEILVGGRRCKQIGRICMDQFMVDLDNIDAKTNDEAVLIGRQGNEEITADELAQILGTINYEIVCKVASRIPRVYING